MSSFYIPKPCHENWDKMSPKEQGRHCAVCSKVVVDFTKKTPTEITDVMANAEGKVCGHFNIKQLDQKAQAKVFANPLNLFNKNWKYFAISIFGFFAFNKKAEAQLKGKVAIRGDIAPIDYHDTNSEVTALNGTVTSNNGDRISGANIIIASNGKEIANIKSIANGSYSVKIEPGKIVSRKITITVTHPSYETKNINDLNISKAVTRLNIVMEEEIMMLGEVAFIPEDTTVETINQPDTIKGEVIIVDPIEKIGVMEPTDTTITCTQTYTPVDTSNQENNTTKVPETPVTNLVIRPEDITASVYPNPAGTNATVYCNKEDKYTLEVFSLNGQLQQTASFNGDRYKLDVSKLERGTYFIRVNNETGTLNTLKLVKN